MSDAAQLKPRSRPARPGEASFFYFDHHFQYNAVKVLPGEYFVTGENMVICTVLGSCIAACLWDRTLNLGGMNHFMLPDGDSSDSSGRYGSYAMELLINEMIKLGARRETMQAKIFGGGQVMANFTTMNVGERNTEFVTQSCRKTCWIFIRAKWSISLQQVKPWSNVWHMHILKSWWRKNVPVAARLSWPRPTPAAVWTCFERG